MACDFVYAAQSARFALTEVTLGIMPGAAGTQNLPRAVGVRRAKEIILTGHAVHAPSRPANGAWSTRCAPTTELMAEVLADGAPHRRQRAGVGAPGQEVARQGHRARPQSGYAFEIEAYNRTVATEDRQEGINAFNEKRKPKYKGR